MNGDFVWRDAGRTVVFRGDGIARAPGLLREHGFERFELLSSARALSGAPELAEAATRVREVGPGQVPDLAAELLGSVDSPAIVALGGGRPIDVAKALAAVTGAAVVAIPTTMSGAEMTGIHRLPTGAESRVGSLVRPALVIADPVAMTSQDEPALRASSMNALAHGADSLYTPFSNPMSELAARRGAALIATSLDVARAERDPAQLALGSLLCGYAIDSAMFGLHHVVCQTLVRVCGSPHAETNAAILPRSLDFLVGRDPDGFADLAVALGTAPGDVEARVLELGGDPPGLGAAGADRSRLDEAIGAMRQRQELAFTPGGPPSEAALTELVERAW